MSRHGDWRNVRGVGVRRWVVFVAIILLGAFHACEVRAMRPVWPPCETVYPAFSHASLEEVMDKLRSSRDRESYCLQMQLPRFGERALAPLVALLRSDSELGRVNAASGLGLMREQAISAAPDLEHALDDPSGRVRAMVLYALTTIQPRSPALTTTLLKRLEETNPASLDGEALISTVASLGPLPPEALPVLQQVLERIPLYDPRAARDAIESISHVAAPQRLPVLARLVGDKDPQRSARAVLALGRSGVWAVPVLLSRLADSSDPGRQAYERALQWAWYVAATPALAAYYQADMPVLLRQLRTPDAVARKQAIEQLASVAPAFAAAIPLPGQGEESLGMAQSRCTVMDALSASHPPDKQERKAILAVAMTVRQAAPDSTCPVPIY